MTKASALTSCTSELSFLNELSSFSNLSFYYSTSYVILLFSWEIIFISSSYVDPDIISPLSAGAVSVYAFYSTFRSDAKEKLGGLDLLDCWLDLLSSSAGLD